MHLSGVPISFETSAFIVLGTNIGTSITTVIASIPTNRDSKRAALFHITYDIIGSLVFGTLIYFLPCILTWFAATWAEKARQVAMFHTLYNVATMILLFPFVKWIAVLMQKVVPLKKDEVDKTYEKKLLYLDSETAQMPAMAAVNAAHSEVCRMGKIAKENLTLSLESFFERNANKADRTLEIEKTINFLNHQIASKLVEINNMALSEVDAEKVGKMFKILSDMERIGDHAENIAEYAIIVTERDLKFSDAAIEELQLLGDLVTQQIARAINMYEKPDESVLPQIKSFEKEVDKISKVFTENHISRLKIGNCDPKGGVIFTDMIIDLERSADHARNIALSAILPKSKIKPMNKPPASNLTAAWRRRGGTDANTKEKT